MVSVPDPNTGMRSVSVLEPLNGGGGATARGDGVAGNDSACGYLKNTPIESIESHVAVLVERYELLADSAGFGAHRGGWGVCLEFRLLVPKTIVTARGMERCRFEPWGAQGGNAAGRTRAFVQRAGAEGHEHYGAIDVLHLGPGDRVRLEATGGGGYGPRLDRDPEDVVFDVRSGLLSESVALEAYGVVLAPQQPSGFDARATATRRAQLRDTSVTAELIDLGPARRDYEQVWTSPVADIIAERLQQQPLAFRSWVRRELQARIDDGLGPLDAWDALADELVVLRDRSEQ